MIYCKKKYETKVGTKGGQLSGGEKQRVAIGNIILLLIVIYKVLFIN